MTTSDIWTIYEISKTTVGVEKNNWNNMIFIPLNSISNKYLAIFSEVEQIILRFGVFTVVTMKNGVSLDVTPCGSCKNRRFGGI
jgi:hypothetical protein